MLKKEYHMIKQSRKILVFDVDGTLLYRTMQKLLNLQYDFKTKGRYIYLRPNLHHLAFHLQKIGQKSMIVLWTSMMRKNAEEIYQKLGSLGLNFQRLYTQQNCNQNLSKDLRVVASDLKADVNDIYLIDDSPHKRIKNQNFIFIKEYDGKDNDDNEMIRIVKQLYKILGMPFQQKFIQSAEEFNLEFKMKKLSLNKSGKVGDEKKLDGGSDKKEKNRRNQDKKQAEGKNSKNEGLKNQVLPQKRQQKQIIFNHQTKVIVFDLNKTLVTKRKQLDDSIQHLKNNSKIQGNIIYDRPLIHLLQNFRSAHPQYQIKYFVWTTMQGKKVEQDCRKVVEGLAAKFEGVYNGVERQQGPGKDLRKITQKYGCLLQNTVLVDDSWYKNVNNQNYIKILPYTGQKQDLQMIRIVSKLEEFIKCSNPGCQTKKMLENSQKQFMQACRKYKQAKKDEQNKMKIYKQDAIECNVKDEKSIKCLVFDINETLLVRTIDAIKDVPIDGKNKHYNIYIRPHLDKLSDFLSAHPNIQVCLWSTIKSYNCKVFQQVFSKKGFNYNKLLSQEDLIDEKKDLKLISQIMKVPVQKIVLIDDNPKKSIEGQNYIKIRSFDGSNQNDKSLLLLMECLGKICEQNPKDQSW